MKRIVLLGALFIGTLVSAAAADGHRPSLTEEEETYELRLQKVRLARGEEAQFALLKQDMQQNPRPYVKAWYGNSIVWKEKRGLKIPEEADYGVEMIRQSAAEGSRTGLEFQGRALVYGWGGQAKKPREGAAMIRLAAELGRYTAMEEIARLYAHGYGVPKDLPLAHAWAYKAAYQGTSGGLYYLGTLWEEGKLTGGADLAKAAEYYHDAAWCGHPEAVKRLNELIKKKEPAAQMFVHLVAVEHVNMSAELISLSVDADLLPSRIRKAVAWLEKNAADNVRAKLAVAQLRLRVLQPVYDPTKARRVLESLAAENNDDAVYWLAHARFEGIGEKADRAGALEVWRRLAAKGHPLSLHKLGTLYYWGHSDKLGLSKDPIRAFVHVKEAADKGCWHALFNLASCYEHGIGTGVNYHMAAKCWSILEDHRVDEATRRKNAILANLKD